VPFSYEDGFFGPKRANLVLTITVYFARPGNRSAIGPCFSGVVSSGAVSSRKRNEHFFMMGAPYHHHRSLGEA
jgi:hypothetical protein